MKGKRPSYMSMRRALGVCTECVNRTPLEYHPITCVEVCSSRAVCLSARQSAVFVWLPSHPPWGLCLAGYALVHVPCLAFPLCSVRGGGAMVLAFRRDHGDLFPLAMII